MTEIERLRADLVEAGWVDMEAVDAERVQFLEERNEARTDRDAFRMALDEASELLGEAEADRDALTARIEAALAIIGPHPAYSTLWDVQRALSPQEGT